MVGRAVHQIRAVSCRYETAVWIIEIANASCQHTLRRHATPQSSLPTNLPNHASWPNYRYNQFVTSSLDSFGHNSISKWSVAIVRKLVWILSAEQPLSIHLRRPFRDNVWVVSKARQDRLLNQIRRALRLPSCAIVPNHSVGMTKTVFRTESANLTLRNIPLCLRNGSMLKGPYPGIYFVGLACLLQRSGTYRSCLAPSRR